MRLSLQTTACLLSEVIQSSTTGKMLLPPSRPIRDSSESAGDQVEEVWITWLPPLRLERLEGTLKMYATSLTMREVKHLPDCSLVRRRFYRRDWAKLWSNIKPGKFVFLRLPPKNALLRPPIFRLSKNSDTTSLLSIGAAFLGPPDCLRMKLRTMPKCWKICMKRQLGKRYGIAMAGRTCINPVKNFTPSSKRRKK